MKKHVVMLALLSFKFLAMCQSVDSQDSINQFEKLMNKIYEDSKFKAKIVSYAEEIEKHPTHNDSFLIKKFPLVLSKGGADWFAKFAATKNRVIFYKNFNDTIIDLSRYFEEEIKYLDYDSINIGGYSSGDLTVFNKFYEGFLNETYRFFKNGKEVRFITLSFWGGKQFYSWQDEPQLGMRYIIPITRDANPYYTKVKTISPKP
jgi:hypothetical protein